MKQIFPQPGNFASWQLWGSQLVQKLTFATDGTAALEGRLQSLENAGGPTAQDLTTLQEVQQSQQLAIQNANENIANHETRIDALEETTTGYGGRITSLESRPQPVDYSGDISLLDSRLDAIDPQLISFDGRLDSLEARPVPTDYSGDISALDGRLDIVEGSLTAYDNRLDALEGGADYSAQIAGLDTRIDSLELVRPPPFRSGRFYALHDEVMIAAIFAAANSLRLYPFLLRQPLTLNRLFIRVTTGQTGGAIKSGIWGSDANGWPTGLPLTHNNSAPFAATATAVPSADVTAVTLQPGIYWMGSVSAAATTQPSTMSVGGGVTRFTAMFGTATQNNAIGSGVNNWWQGFSTPQTYTDNLGAKDLTGAALTDIAATVNAGTPILGVRAA